MASGSMTFIYIMYPTQFKYLTRQIVVLTGASLGVEGLPDGVLEIPKSTKVWDHHKTTKKSM